MFPSRFLSVAALAAVMSLGLLASHTPAAHAGPGKAAKHAAKLPKYLGAVTLTTDQKQKLTPIVRAAKEKTRALRADAKLTDAQKKDAVKTLHQSTRAEVLAVLTPAQRAQLPAPKHANKKKAI